MLMDSRPSLSLLPARASFDVRGVNRSPPQQAHLKAESASTEGDDDPFKIGIHFPTSTPMFSVPNNLKLRESAKVDKPSPPDRNSRPALSVRFGTESVTVYAKNAPVRRRSFSLENEIGTIASDPRNTHSRGDLPPHLRASRKPVPSCSAPVTPRSPRAKQPVSADTVASTCSPGSSSPPSQISKPKPKHKPPPVPAAKGLPANQKMLITRRHSSSSLNTLSTHMRRNGSHDGYAATPSSSLLQLEKKPAPPPQHLKPKLKQYPRIRSTSNVVTSQIRPLPSIPARDRHSKPLAKTPTLMSSKAHSKSPVQRKISRSPTKPCPMKASRPLPTTPSPGVGRAKPSRSVSPYLAPKTLERTNTFGGKGRLSQKLKPKPQFGASSKSAPQLPHPS